MTAAKVCYTSEIALPCLRIKRSTSMSKVILLPQAEHLDILLMNDGMEREADRL